MSNAFGELSDLVRKRLVINLGLFALECTGGSPTTDNCCKFVFVEGLKKGFWFFMAVNNKVGCSSRPSSTKQLMLEFYQQRIVL